MLQPFIAFANRVDSDGNPSGGMVSAVGMTIHWQDGPLSSDGKDERYPNGAFVETVIAAAKQRLEFFQTATDGRFACDENAGAIDALDIALEQLHLRTAQRIARGVEGTHAP